LRQFIVFIRDLFMKIIALNSLKNACVAILVLLLQQQAYAQRHDDSVSSGKSKGKRQIGINSPSVGNQSDIGGADYFMKNIPLRSTTVPFNRHIVSFGPFQNISNDFFSITLQHIGAGGSSISVGIVDGVEVVRSQSASTFTIPPGSSYGWQVLSEHSITASTFVRGFDSYRSGLPAKDDFLFPQRNSVYKGCVNVYAYDREGAASELTGAKYYFGIGSMTDGSDAWNVMVLDSPFAGPTLEGPPPKQGVGPCLEGVKAIY
jgi:hypothetical protein